MVSVKQHLLFEIAAQLSFDDGSVFMFGLSGNSQLQVMLSLLSEITISYSLTRSHISFRIGYTYWWNASDIKSLFSSGTEAPGVDELRNLNVAFFLIKRCYRLRTDASILTETMASKAIKANSSISKIEIIDHVENAKLVYPIIPQCWPNVLQIRGRGEMFEDNITTILTSLPRFERIKAKTNPSESFFEKITHQKGINRFVFEMNNFEAVKKLNSDTEYVFTKTLKIGTEKMEDGWHVTNVTARLKPSNNDDKKTMEKIKAFCESFVIRKAIESLQAYSASPINFTNDKLESVVTQSEGNSILKRHGLEYIQPMFYKNDLFTFVVERTCRKRKHS